MVAVLKIELTRINTKFYQKLRHTSNEASEIFFLPPTLFFFL